MRPPPAVPAGSSAAVPFSLPAQLPPADRERQAQEDDGDGRRKPLR